MRLKDLVCKALSVMADTEGALSQHQVAIEIYSCDDMWRSLYA